VDLPGRNFAPRPYPGVETAQSLPRL